ncbi:MAG: hypothetical protein RIQ81_386 [Pseudomonadota bacterium]|jgi:hypothetical protein
MRQLRVRISNSDANKGLMSLGLFFILAASSACTDGNFSSNSPLTKKTPGGNGLQQGLPTAASGGGSSGTDGRVGTDEGGESQVTELQLSGSWGFDGCGKITFDLTTGNISVTPLGTPRFFRNELNFSFKRKDGSLATVQVGAADAARSANIPDWTPACIKSQVQTPILTPLSRTKAALPVQVTGGQPGSKRVEYLFDDDGGSPNCPSNHMDLPGAVSVDGASFKLELTKCP